MVAMLLFHYAYRELSFHDALAELRTVKLGWVGLSILSNFLTHVIRAYRWQLMIASLKLPVTFFDTILAEMVGLFTNLFIPRLGDVTRCTALTRLKKVPMGGLLGTVIAERLLDVISFLFLVGIVIFWVDDRISDLLYQHLFHIPTEWNSTKGYFLATLFFLLTLAIGIITYKTRAKWESYFVVNKLKKFLSTLWRGVISIKMVATPVRFWLATVLIWVSTFFVGYCWFFAMEATSSLTWTAGWAVVVMANLGLSAPVQGGVGIYHILVRTALTAYGISRADGTLYAVLTHWSHLMLVIVGGGIGTIIVLLREKKKK